MLWTVHCIPAVEAGFSRGVKTAASVIQEAVVSIQDPEQQSISKALPQQQNVLLRDVCPNFFWREVDKC
jgi:hypothetical protein